MNYYWPIALTVLSNTLYHICAKSTPSKVNPFLSLTVTYLIAAAVSAFLFSLFRHGGGFAQECRELNWTAFALGASIVALEVGCIYMYKVGWSVNTGYLVQSVFLAAALLAVGFLLYKEPVTMTKLAGLAFCAAGLFFLNR